MATVSAIFDGRSFVPSGDVTLEAGSHVKLHFELDEPGIAKPLTALQELAAAAAEFENDDVHLPGDLSAQHDHYLYGTPKRTDP